MKLKQNLTRKLGRAVLQTKKNSPHIFFAAGVIGVTGAAVLACQATLKLESTMEKIGGDVKTVKRHHENGKITDKEKDRLLALKYVRGGVALGKLYGPAIIVGGVSIGLLTGSHVQMTRRNSALTATVALLSKSLDDYRNRVRTELGNEKENELYRGITTEKTEVDGKKVKIKHVEGCGSSPYARIFSSQTSAEWHPNAELNRNFIQCQQNYANHKLHANGHVMLNDVYDMLGLDRSSAGAVVGWVLDGDGDNFIDFGMYQDLKNADSIFGTGFEVFLDFNVDGVVYELIDRKVGEGK